MVAKPDAPQQSYPCIQHRVEFILEKNYKGEMRKIFFSDSHCPYFLCTTRIETINLMIWTDQGPDQPAGKTYTLNFISFFFFTDLILFRYTTPRFLHCSYSSVSIKWSAIFVRHIVPVIYSCFSGLPELNPTLVLF